MNDSYLIHLQNAFASQPPEIAFQKKNSKMSQKENSSMKKKENEKFIKELNIFLRISNL